jgi:starch synthase
MVQGLKVLVLAAEATPLAKVGGLGDVAGELPPALRELGLDVLLSLPLHPTVDAAGVRVDRSIHAQIPMAGESGGVIAHLGEVNGIPVLLIDGEPIRATPSVYADAEANGRKFGFFSLAALESCRVLGWRPAVVHSNDWHTAPAVYWISAHRPGDAFWRDTATILTIHNLGFMGAGSENALSLCGLQPAEDPRLPDWARTLPLPVGLLTADWLTAVSLTYAEEIRAPASGFGLEGLLESRADHLEGILNGIDPERWDPRLDPALPARFSRATLERRNRNRNALFAELGLQPEASTPILAMVTRLDSQKGVDLALEALDTLSDVGWSFILLGTGEPALEQQAESFARRHRGRAAVALRFDAPLSRRIFGGADMLLVPSRYEPCGLAQMIAMRYGCIPIVRATGGLKDTVRDELAGEGTGFTFADPTPESLAQAVRRAVSAYSDRGRWGELQQRAMASDFSWRRSAEKYAGLYRRAVDRRRAAQR